MSKKTDKRSFSPQLKKTLTLVLPVAAGGVIVDQLTKIWAASCLKNHSPIEIIPGVIRLHYAENTGAAFSMLSGQRVFFIALTVIVLAVVGYVLWKGHIRNHFGYCAVALCVSGTIGNFIDRLLYGYPAQDDGRREPGHDPVGGQSRRQPHIGLRLGRSQAGSAGRISIRTKGIRRRAFCPPPLLSE